VGTRRCSIPAESHFDLLPADFRRVLIAVNRTAGAGARQNAADHLMSELSSRGFEASIVGSLDELSLRAAEMQNRGELRGVVAIGGDGTAAEIVNRTPVGTPIAVFPTGTENLLAGYLGIQKDPAALAVTIAAGRTVWLDAGRAGERIFLLMASAGFDAEVVHRLHSERSGNIRHLSYIKPIWHAIRNYRYPELRVKCALSEGSSDQPQWSEPIDCRWAFTFNLPKYGFGLKFAPQASGLDGLFDVCTFRRGRLLPGLGYLASVVLRLHRGLPGFKLTKCSRLRIESDEPVHYELDGDPGGTLPVELEVVPRRLRLVVPENFSPT
jgi:diacylglycerol kinase (ATP)